MSIYKRGETWYIQVTAKNGRRIQQSAGTKVKREAQELHDKIKNESWKEVNLEVKPSRSWEEAAVRWMREKTSGDDIKYLRWLHPYLKGMNLTQIDREMLEFLKAEKLKTGVSNNTVNHTLSFVRAVLNRAKDDWQWLETAPTIKMLPVAPMRISWITVEQADRLFKELPEHIEAMARFTLATGLRESNVTGLQWSQIDLQRQCAWIYADQAKAGKNIAVPLNSEALAVLRDQTGKHHHNVFAYKGKPIKKANTLAWRKALIRAGIDNFRWHDLRHTWASWHVQSGTPLNALQELGGWADMTMVMRYAHLSSDHLKDYAKNVERSKSKSFTANLLQLVK